MHQIVTAGVHEQVDELGSVVVTVLDNPAMMEDVPVVPTHQIHKAPPRHGRWVGHGAMMGRDQEQAREGTGHDATWPAR